MTYYHIRYNIYPPPGFAVEKEEWIKLAKKYNEQQVKRLLIDKYKSEVSIITCSYISREEFEENHGR